MKNPELSLRDRGLVVTLLSLPDNWDFSISGLACILPDGKYAIRAGLDHLEAVGYITKSQDRTEQGKFGRNIIEIHETPKPPLSGFWSSGNSPSDKPSTGKCTQYINNQFNNKECTLNQSIHPESKEDKENDIQQLEQLIAENIHLDAFYKVAENNKAEHEIIREIYDTICDVVCVPRKKMTIKGTSYPWQIVKAQFLKLKPVHISNLLGRLIDNQLEIKNMQAYLISALYMESLSGTLKNQAEIHDDYLKFLRGNPYQNIT